jgi:predicted RNA-binding Zn-ribbon protein involved in translation (DUF1610 family)
MTNCIKCGTEVEVIQTPVFRSHLKCKYICPNCGFIKEWKQQLLFKIGGNA